MKTYNSVKSPFIVKVFEASTGHITKEDDKLLKKDDICAVSVYQVKDSGGTCYGYLIYTGLDDTDSFTKESLKEAGFSVELFNLLDLAKKKGCKFLQLDCDGVSYEDLPTFNW